MNPAHLGRKTWVLPGGHIPPHSTGPEPAHTSYDQLSILNTQPKPAQLTLSIYYSGQPLVGPYWLEVPARRIKHIRLNELIDPLPLPLDVPFSCLIEASVPVLVQFTRQNTTQREQAGYTTLAFAAASGVHPPGVEHG
jgi:hypothetical protein